MSKRETKSSGGAAGLLEGDRSAWRRADVDDVEGLTAARAVVGGFAFETTKGKVGSSGEGTTTKVLDRRGAWKRASGTKVSEGFWEARDGVKFLSVGGWRARRNVLVASFELWGGGGIEIDDGKVQRCVCGRGGVFILPLHKISTRQSAAMWSVLAGGGGRVGRPGR